MVPVLSPWCLINIFSLSSSSSPTSLVLLNSSQVNFFSSMSIILLGIIPNPYVYILIFYQTLVRWASCPRQPTYILIFYQTLVRWASCPPYNYFIAPSCYLFNFRLVIMADFLGIFNFHPISSSWRL